MDAVLTPEEIVERAMSYELVIAQFVNSRRMYIVPPKVTDNSTMYRANMQGLELAQYIYIAEQVLRYNRYYPKF